MLSADRKIDHEKGNKKVKEFLKSFAEYCQTGVGNVRAIGLRCAKCFVILIFKVFVIIDLTL